MIINGRNVWNSSNVCHFGVRGVITLDWKTSPTIENDLEEVDEREGKKYIDWVIVIHEIKRAHLKQHRPFFTGHPPPSPSSWLPLAIAKWKKWKLFSAGWVSP